MKNKKILLVGGCGFIGHNLAIHLKKKNFEPIIIDSLSINNLNSINDEEIKNKHLYKSILETRIDLLKEHNIKLIIQDVREHKKVLELFSSINPDIIIHLAAVSHANKSNKDPHTTFDNSLRTLENTLDYSRKNKTHVIYLSSSMVYGNFNNKTVDESTICDPIGIYGNLKLSSERMIKSYSGVFDMPYTIIRPSALYGERCVSRRVGQIFIENAINDKEIKIGGDGEDKLDFTYIKDLCNGVILSIEKKEALNEIFNLTYGGAKTINNLKDILLDNFPNAKITYEKRDKLMPKRGTLSINKAKKLLGYNPTFPIEEAYPAYIKWYKEFLNN